LSFGAAPAGAVCQGARSLHPNRLPGNHFRRRVDGAPGGIDLDQPTRIDGQPPRCGRLTKEWPMTIKILPNERGNPPGKLAEAEMHFSEGPLEGLKLIGFAVWEKRGGNGRNVTFPARSYAVNGERRSFSLLRPIVDSTAQEKLRQQILDAYAEFEERVAIASSA
jgi:hypothetical protein